MMIKDIWAALTGGDPIPKKSTGHEVARASAADHEGEMGDAVAAAWDLIESLRNAEELESYPTMVGAVLDFLAERRGI